MSPGEAQLPRRFGMGMILAVIFASGCAQSSTATMAETQDASIAASHAWIYGCRVRNVDANSFMNLFAERGCTRFSGDGSCLVYQYLGLRGGHGYMAACRTYHVMSGMMGQDVKEVFRCPVSELPANMPTDPDPPVSPMYGNRHSGELGIVMDPEELDARGIRIIGGGNEVTPAPTPARP